MSNHYQAPGAAPVENMETYLPRFLSLSGRIGRLRYLAYGMGISVLSQLLLVPLIFVGIGAGSGVDAGIAGALPFVVIGIVYLGVIVFTFGYLVRRLNDINQSGWLSLLILIPVINLILILVALFAPGTHGSNRYGPAPVANSTGVIVIAWLLGLIVIGIVLAIAVPALMGYPGAQSL